MPWDLKDLEQSLLIGSTLVEGSTLTEGEAREVLAGRTVSGHSIQEVRELLNYRTAVERLTRELSDTPFLSIDLIRDFHARLFAGLPGTAGRFKSYQNFTYLEDGTRMNYVSPARVVDEMDAWVLAMNRDENPVATERVAAQAAELYYHFQLIHPFEDGNGRIGRVLIAYWLFSKHGLSFSFYAKDKVEHLAALQDFGKGHKDRLARFFSARMKRKP